jgi:hypothetical protein
VLECSQSYGSRFTVNWLTANEVFYDDVSHLPRWEGKNMPVTRGFDGEMQASSGEELMRRFGVPLGP